MSTWIELFKCISDPPHPWRPPQMEIIINYFWQMWVLITCRCFKYWKLKCKKARCKTAIDSIVDCTILLLLFLLLLLLLFSLQNQEMPPIS